MIEKVDYLIILNKPSLERFKTALVPGGTMFVNSTIVTENIESDAFNVVMVDAGKIASDIGDPRVMNLVIAGAFIVYTDLLPAENVLQTAFKKLGAKRPELNPLNEKAFNIGLKIGREARA